ncbi:MAG TPA: SAM-dependent chlorinase/fluorinase [Anaerolineae bacterium]|nr:SAM-dependent chlorinase/fluorinase [Anaerolineae bacterium]HQK13693.1 SAM-dependent chlorinase/fluorinase [Anaerolineae bacterium]
MLITITTDFGTRDGYVGTMKGVIAGIAPGVPCIDITHEIPPQDVRSAAYILWTALPYFPPESIHVVVVDPGVGTARRPIAARTPWGILVGPDNGIFSYVWEAAPPECIVELINPAYRNVAVSNTFHGRDIFSPAAAHLARGVPLTDFGPEVRDPVRLPAPVLTVGDTIIKGEVIYIDHFGNVITSIGRLVWDGALLTLDPAFGDAPAGLINAGRVHVFAAGRDLGPIRHTYGEVSAGEPLALVGSEGLLELAVNRGHGAQMLGLTPGASVEISLDVFSSRI